MSASNDPYELGWAAGFYEGEGSFAGMVYPAGRPSNVRSLALRVYQADRAPLDRFQRVVGCGRVCLEQRASSKRLGIRPMWIYVASSYHDVKQVVALIWPGLSERRRVQIGTAIERYEKRPMQRLHPRTHTAALGRMSPKHKYAVIESAS